MAVFKITLALLSIAVGTVLTDGRHPSPPSYPHPAPSYNPPSPSYNPPSPYKEPGKPYNYGYEVKDEYKGVQFSADETSDGNNVKGSYQVALPDGRYQNVNYAADHHAGFNAEVTYTGEAQYPPTSYHPAPPPKYHPAPAPSYHPAPAPYHPPPPPYRG